MLRPAALTVDDRVRPLATRESPRFGWLLERVPDQDAGDPEESDAAAGPEAAGPDAAGPGAGDDVPIRLSSGRQAAYQIRVTDASGRVVWDTGRVDSEEQRHIPYAGEPLEQGAPYTWTVRVWADGLERPSEWAPAESFEYGLRDEDWHACWIRRRPGGAGPLAEVDGVLRAAGGGLTLLRGSLSGREEKGFAVEFGVRIRIRCGGWALTDDSGRNGLVWRLLPRQGLAVHVLRDGELEPADVISTDVPRGHDHRIVLRLQDDALQTSIDGTTVDRRPAPGSPLGRFGVYQRHGEEADFSDLTVRAGDGSVVLDPEHTGRLDAWDNTSDVRQIDEWTLARREFELRDAELARARCYLASHHHADLHVNGERVGGRGSFAYPGEGYYQVVDLTERLAGVRRAAVGVWFHWYGNGQGRPAGEPGLLVRIVLDYADGERQVVVSDESWKVREGPYLQAGYRNDEGDPIEHLDLRAIPHGWDRPGFPDEDWPHAEVLGPHPTAPFTHLWPQESRLAEVPVRPVELRIADDGTPVADFGRVIPARPVVRFSHGRAGRVVRIRGGYNLTETGRVATSTLLTQGTDMSFPCTQADGVQTYRAFTHLGFRYLEIPGAGEDLGIDDISAVVVHAEPPGFLKPAEFESSDPTLDAVFDLLRRSALYGVQEQFVDTPTREKGQFLADAVNISYATMALYGERTSTRQAIREFLASAKRYWNAEHERGRYNAVYPNGDGKRDIPDFSLMMPEWVRRYLQETGDTGLVAEAYPALRDTADYVLRHVPADGPCAGLVADLAGGGGPYLYGIVDWPAPGRFGYDMDTSARTTVNAQAVGVLRDVAHLGRVLGRPGTETAWYDERADRLVETVNDRLLRSDGKYADGLYADGVRSPHASQHATSFALMFGLVPREVRSSAADHVQALGMRQGPLTAHRLVHALGSEGRVDAVLRLLTNAEDHGWAKVLADGGTFTWEAWTLDEGTNHSQSHGWGAQAAIDVVEFLLGVRVTAPGAAEIEIRPPRCALTHARGAVPTERGVVHVEWQRVDAQVRVRVEVPPNVRATVHLPAEGDATAW